MNESGIDCWKGVLGDPKGGRQGERARHQGGKQGNFVQGDAGRPWASCSWGSGPGLFAFNIKGSGHSKVGRDPTEETRLTLVFY